MPSALAVYNVNQSMSPTVAHLFVLFLRFLELLFLAFDLVCKLALHALAGALIYRYLSALVSLAMKPAFSFSELRMALALAHGIETCSSPTDSVE